jgi:hypothetical protein
MRWTKWMVILLTVSLAVVGCNKKGDVDTAPLEKSFAQAPPADKGPVDQAVAAVKKGDYAGAMAALQPIAAKASLTPEQKKAVQDLVAQLQAKVQEAMGQVSAEGKKMMDSGKKAADDIKNAIPGTK